LPPKVYYFEPRIYGFKIAGKRGSKYYKPSTGEISLINERQAQLENEISERPKQKLQQ